MKAKDVVGTKEFKARPGALMAVSSIKMPLIRMIRVYCLNFWWFLAAFRHCIRLLSYQTYLINATQFVNF